MLISVSPDRPITHAGLHELFVNKTAHVTLVQWEIERHPMHVADLKTVHVAANFAGKLICRAPPGFQWIIMSHKNILSFYFAAMDFEHMVFHDINVIIKFIGGKFADDLA